MPIKVFLVQGRDMIRQGIKAMLGQKENVQVVGEAATEEEALEKLKIRQPDVILMDLNSSVSAALDFTNQIKSKYPKIRILILTLHDYESSLIRLLEGGADGYILKNTSQDELVYAIEKVKKDGSYLKPGFILDILAKYKDLSENTNKLSAGLLEREVQVLELIAEGLTNVEMAKKLFTSVRTIETRRKKLLDKTGTSNTATLIRFAVLNGLIK